MNREFGKFLPLSLAQDAAGQHNIVMHNIKNVANPTEGNILDPICKKKEASTQLLLPLSQDSAA